MPGEGAAKDGGGDTGADDAMDQSVLVPEGEAVVYEEELLANPYSLKLWLRYLQARALPFPPLRLLGCGARPLGAVHHLPVRVCNSENS
jgi:hypothetical protein